MSKFTLCLHRNLLSIQFSLLFHFRGGVTPPEKIVLNLRDVEDAVPYSRNKISRLKSVIGVAYPTLCTYNFELCT